jgi:hypothetical protein
MKSEISWPILVLLALTAMPATADTSVPAPLTCQIGSSAPNLVPISALGPNLFLPRIVKSKAPAVIQFLNIRVVSGNCVSHVTSARAVGLILNNNFYGDFANPIYKFEPYNTRWTEYFRSNYELQRARPPRGEIVYATYKPGGVLAVVKTRHDWRVSMFTTYSSENESLSGERVLLTSRVPIVSAELSSGYGAESEDLTVASRQSNDRLLLAFYRTPWKQPPLANPPPP